MKLIHGIAKEITEWMGRHQGRAPSRILVPKPLHEALIDELKKAGIPDLGSDLLIRGISIAIDYNKNLCEMLE